MIEDANPHVFEPRDLTVEVFTDGDRPKYYRASHKESGLCLEAPSPRQAVDAINAEMDKSA